jgi:hypothetical protein
MKSTKLTIKYALTIYGALISYFFLMKLAGLEHFTELRLFNFFIVLGGLYLLLKENMTKNTSNYFHNLFLGFRTAGLAIVLTVISLFIYLEAINPSFMNVLESSMVWGNDLTMFQVSLTIGIEGIASSYLLTYMVMQYMKNYNENTELSKVSS